MSCNKPDLRKSELRPFPVKAYLKKKGLVKNPVVLLVIEKNKEVKEKKFPFRLRDFYIVIVTFVILVIAFSIFILM